MYGSDGSMAVKVNRHHHKNPAIVQELYRFQDNHELRVKDTADVRTI